MILAGVNFWDAQAKKLLDKTPLLQADKLHFNCHTNLNLISSVVSFDQCIKCRACSVVNNKKECNSMTTGDTVMSLRVYIFCDFLLLSFLCLFDSQILASSIWTNLNISVSISDIVKI